MKAFSIAFFTIIFGFSLLSFGQQGGPSLSVSLSPEATSEGESVTLQIGVEFESAAGISTPKFDAPDFDIVGQSNSIEIVTVMANGRFVPKRKNSYNFMLAPRKTGSLSIKNIRLEIGGKTYTARDQTVRVEAGRPSRGGIAKTDEKEEVDESLPQDQDPSLHSSRNIKLNSDFTVVVELSKKRAFVGEPIIAEYYLYDFGNLTRVDIKKWPTFNGFWKEDLEIPTRFDFKDEYSTGRRVRRALLGRFALYPLKPGKLEISKLVVGGTFISNTNSARGNDPFNAFFGLRTLKQATHASQEVAIAVEGLPSNGKPTNFSGAVGDFQVNFSADKTTVKANEPITFKFTVSGTGNFQSIEAPSPPFPPEFEAFETSANVQSSAPRGVRIDLKKSVSFDQLVIPRKEGKFTIPSFEWNYFSPSSGSYQTTRSQPVEIDVSGVAQVASAAPPTPGLNQDQSKAALLVKDDIRYIKTANQVNASQNIIPLLNKILLAILALLNFALFTIWLKGIRSKSRPSKEKLRAEHLKKSMQELNAHSPESLEHALVCFFESLLHMDCRGMTSEEIESMCDQRGAPKAQAAELLQMLRQCHAERYSADKKLVASDFAARKKRLEKILKELNLA